MQPRHVIPTKVKRKHWILRNCSFGYFLAVMWVLGIIPHSSHLQEQSVPLTGFASLVLTLNLTCTGRNDFRWLCRVAVLNNKLSLYLLIETASLFTFIVSSDIPVSVISGCPPLPAQLTWTGHGSHLLFLEELEFFSREPWASYVSLAAFMFIISKSPFQKD